MASYRNVDAYDLAVLWKSLLLCSLLYKGCFCKFSHPVEQEGLRNWFGIWINHFNNSPLPILRHISIGWRMHQSKILSHFGCSTLNMFRSTKYSVTTFCPLIHTLQQHLPQAARPRFWLCSPQHVYQECLFSDDLLPSHACCGAASHSGRSFMLLVVQPSTCLAAMIVHCRPFALWATAFAPHLSNGYFFQGMAHSFEGPDLARFYFAPYNTAEFSNLNAVQQWNESDWYINDLSVQILEIDIYEGPEKNSLEYKKVLWEATNLRWWHRWAASVIQLELWKGDLITQHVHVWFHCRWQHGQVVEMGKCMRRLSTLMSAHSVQWSWGMGPSSWHQLP